MTNGKVNNTFRNMKRSTRSLAEWVIIRPLAAALGISLLDCAHRQMGIGDCAPAAAGEQYLISRMLPQLLNGTAPVIFDVGANIGDYSRMLLRQFVQATIYAFEPVPGNFAVLAANISKSNVHRLPMGLGERQETLVIYDYAQGIGSQHASLYRNVFSDFHKATAISEAPVPITTLDDFCALKSIPRIDFLKIDTEGNELAVLRGGKRMIGAGNVPIIQFEFNEMNVASRCFLKDFYDLLSGYDFYRLAESRLIRLKEYQPRYEIFQFQNILALRNSDYPFARVRDFVYRVR